MWGGCAQTGGRHEICINVLRFFCVVLLVLVLFDVGFYNRHLLDSVMKLRAGAAAVRKQHWAARLNALHCFHHARERDKSYITYITFPFNWSRRRCCNLQHFNIWSTGLIELPRRVHLSVKPLPSLRVFFYVCYVQPLRNSD